MLTLTLLVIIYMNMKLYSNLLTDCSVVWSLRSEKIKI